MRVRDKHCPMCGINKTYPHCGHTWCGWLICKNKEHKKWLVFDDKRRYIYV